MRISGARRRCLDKNSYECSFCLRCVEEMKCLCPNCGGELVKRPRRNKAS
ncbi:MAG: DUF1272 domain-containing protein [Pseudomonadales bacterium]